MLTTTPFVAALAVSVVLFGQILSVSARPGPDSVHDPEPPLVTHRMLFERMLKAYNRDAPVAVVRFMTSFSLHDITFRDGRHERNVLVPRTRLQDSWDVGKAAVHMDGKFFLVKNIQGLVAPLGRVERTIPVQTRWARDGNYYRFKPFAEESQLAKPVTALAIFQSNSTHILDAELIAPLRNGDIPVCEEFFDHLRTHPLEKISVHEAEALLDSSNHLLVWLGLIRLEQLNMRGARHYHRAILATDGLLSGSLISEMASPPGRYNPARLELLDHLAMLLKNPKKQADVAKFLHDRFAPNMRAQGRLAEVEQLQQLAKDYRDQNRAALKARPDALAELDKFIAWRP